jgi:hypothetical protein
VKTTASCGHEIDVGSCKPAFLAEWLKKLASQPCPECKRKAQQEREAAEQDAARPKREVKAAREPRPKPRLGRLPHGATFHIVYDAEAVKWSGTLTVPQGGIYNASVTTGEDSAVFGLLQPSTGLIESCRRKRGREIAGPINTVLFCHRELLGGSADLTQQCQGCQHLRARLETPQGPVGKVRWWSSTLLNT